MFSNWSSVRDLESAYRLWTVTEKSHLARMIDDVEHHPDWDDDGAARRLMDEYWELADRLYACDMLLTRWHSQSCTCGYPTTPV